MADTKFSLLTALTGAGTATGDKIPLVDVSASTGKTITVAELAIALATLGIQGVTIDANGRVTVGANTNGGVNFGAAGARILDSNNDGRLDFVAGGSSRMDLVDLGGSAYRLRITGSGGLSAGNVTLSSSVISINADAGIERVAAGELMVNSSAGTLGNFRAAGLRTAVITKTANYTATAIDQVILVDATGGAVTITLPAIATGNRGKEYRVKKIDSSINVVTIARTGSDTIDGATTSLLATQFLARDFVAPDTGVDWAAF